MRIVAVHEMWNASSCVYYWYEQNRAVTLCLINDWAVCKSQETIALKSATWQVIVIQYQLSQTLMIVISFVLCLLRAAIVHNCHQQNATFVIKGDIVCHRHVCQNARDAPTWTSPRRSARTHELCFSKESPSSLETPCAQPEHFCSPKQPSHLKLLHVCT